MASTNITIRMDSKLKRDAEELFSDLGMNLTTAFTIFTKQAVREQKLPFVISRAVDTLQVIDDARNGIGMSPSFASVSDLMETLNAED